MLVASGQERCADGRKNLVREMKKAGEKVQLQEYRDMVHSFYAGMSWMKQSQDCIKRRGEACWKLDEKGVQWTRWAETAKPEDLKRT